VKDYKILELINRKNYVEAIKITKLLEELDQCNKKCSICKHSTDNISPNSNYELHCYKHLSSTNKNEVCSDFEDIC